MPTYKLMYFEGKGRAEAIRLALTAAGQEFEDKRFTREEWLKVKPTIPQKQLPCLQVDGRYIPQSAAILRYVGREFGLYGENNDESTRIDVIFGATEDFLKNVINVYYEKDETKKAELKKDLEENKLPQFLDLLEEILKENNGGDGFFVGNKMSIADLLIFDTVDQVGSFVKSPPSFPPKLGALIEKVKNNPRIKEYISKQIKCMTYEQTVFTIFTLLKSKMPTYKLMYFEVKGRAEVIRLALTAAGQEFEDKRFTREEWLKVKPTIPQNQLPCLQVDGRIIPQSRAILRYVGRVFGLYGENIDESTQIDVIIGANDDFFKVVMGVYYEKDETKQAELKKDLEETKLPQFFKLMEGILKENNGGDGFFVGNKMTIADLLIFDTADQVGSFVKLPPLPPKLGALMEKVKNNSRIKEYISKQTSK
ncbi:glutathione S-transferase 3-like [Saccostrea cucullata]|uniref:glutathione S-transferase 3-like n=1 Tax=Saccostrea cuccullata TaxID=36930 RepID=UPI002ED1522D